MKTVLVTGAARGIGYSITERLAGAGWHVLAGVRTDADAAAFAGDRTGAITPILLDITNRDHLSALADQLPADLFAVVNNAGIVVEGPLECLSLTEIATQFDINVLGALAVTQIALPRIRANQGRIIFMSSLSGRVATPCTGAYSASKFALEGLADSLRIELRPWGIRTVLIEPGPTATDMWTRSETALNDRVDQFSEEHRELYAPHIDGMRRILPLVQRFAISPEKSSRAVEKALTSRHPRARYAVGVTTRLQGLAATFTPTWVLDAVLSRLIKR
ncbi:SDR family oxidoreductase [Mycobacteroides salmoniphilum]|uniref:SDR family oxidoreductase n=1 Tax=Mycobacteroides salmoniphilum TaxID=404941 RepID=UPI001064DFF9|nr:SDR family oxidoreductase [Mycobacteroides salmoniphilum]TDZ76885.1 Diacetyl reductase [Mycobacteroides salmoniphilum]TDZ86588.1 Diacetyl reductase [Mycobacteroides salmoniphilum]